MEKAGRQAEDRGRKRGSTVRSWENGRMKKEGRGTGWAGEAAETERKALSSFFFYIHFLM